MNRIERALKRRDSEMGRIAASESGIEPLLRPLPSDELPITPAEVFDRFLREPRGPDAVRQPPVGSGRFVEPSSASGSGLSATKVGFRDFHPAIRGMVVGHPKMARQSAEQYRRLAATLHQAQVERGIKKVMVASAVMGEGKTLTALNLALTLSESYRRRVVLIDADLRCPSVQDLLDIPTVSGLNEALKETTHTRLPLMSVSPRLSVLPAGHADPDPMDQLTSGRMASIFDELSTNFDWVIVDTPPVAMLPDTNLLAGMVDVAVLVVLAGRTPYDLVTRAIQSLGRERVLGIILNRVDPMDGPPSSDYGERYRRLSAE